MWRASRFVAESYNNADKNKIARIRSMVHFSLGIEIFLQSITVQVSVLSELQGVVGWDISSTSRRMHTASFDQHWSSSGV
jgi:hypothetical protein